VAGVHAREVLGIELQALVAEDDGAAARAGRT